MIHYIFVFVYYLPTLWSEGRGCVLFTDDSPEPQVVSDICSVQFSRSVVSDSLRPHESQHARPPCPSSTPRAYSNSCLLNRWCHPTISSSVVLFSSCLRSFPASGSFPMSQLFVSGGQSTGASASAPVLLMNIQGWFPRRLVWSCCPRDQEESSTTVWKHWFSGGQPSLWPTSHIHTWLMEKP